VKVEIVEKYNPRLCDCDGAAAGLTAFSLPFAEPNARASAAVFLNKHNTSGF
jgi:hypothetical protein